MNSKAKLLLGFIVLAVTACLSYYAGTKSVESKTQVTETEKVRKDVVTETKEVVKPDGTREIVSRSVDRSKEDSRTRATTIVKQRLNFLAINKITPIKIAERETESAYEVLIYRQLYSNFSLGIGMDTKFRYKIGLGISF